MRIMTVSSGKGGVGKTSFAINYALNLSQYGSTVLIDLDTGTSSIRNSFDFPINHDLYHFFRKGNKLEECITMLDKKVDPKGRYKNFGFIAGPRRMIEEITNFDAAKRAMLIDSINNLKVDFVVLDLKAGLDHNVLDFLPYSNTGILVFTPHLPSATMAASDMVKAVLFKKLRIIFCEGSPIYDELDLGNNGQERINELLDKVEDVYDDEFANLDAFIVWLHEKLDDHRVVMLIANTVEYFRTYFVLNMFNEVKESYDRAVKPFVENIVENVSSRINIFNLGWIARSDKLHEANCRGIPYLLFDDAQKQKRSNRALQEIDNMWAGLKRDKKSQVEIPKTYSSPNPDDQLLRQLDNLKSMYSGTKTLRLEQNFDYITQRALYLLKSRRVSDFGDVRLFKPGEILKVLFKRGR